jgi:hypothetical protein
VALARIDAAPVLEHSGVGNVSTRVIGLDGNVRILQSVAGVLGGSTRPRRFPIERSAVRPGELVVIATDGITSRLGFDHELPLLRRPPVVIAHHLVTRFGRADDDVLVVGAR